MSRIQATQLLLKLIDGGTSLTELKVAIDQLATTDKPLVQELCFGVARWYFRLIFIVQILLKKPLKKKDHDILVLLLIGIYQLQFTRVPDHAAISETVEVARVLHKEWATKLINAVLRNTIRKQKTIAELINQNEQAYYAHPKWLIQKIKHWPTFEAVLTANNQYPPLCLRINQQKISREEYLAMLSQSGLNATAIPYTQAGIELSVAVDVTKLPMFSSGIVSVQDGAAQLAAMILGAKENELILDACAAPGGKTCHILELEPNVKKLVAIDNEPHRLKKIADNLARLNLQADLICHDVTETSWWDGILFDRILLDAPCSALGVIRRHPDIKLLRKPSDIAALTEIQYRALGALWKTLKPGGYLLYVTCSILPEENELLVTRFIENHDDCVEEIITADWGMKVAVGRQILPGMQSGMDGFYYAKLKRLIL